MKHWITGWIFFGSLFQSYFMAYEGKSLNNWVPYFIPYMQQITRVNWSPTPTTIPTHSFPILFGNIHIVWWFRNPTKRWFTQKVAGKCEKNPEPLVAHGNMGWSSKQMSFPSCGFLTPKLAMPTPDLAVPYAAPRLAKTSGKTASRSTNGWSSNHGNLRYPPPRLPPPINKALLRDY